MLRVLRVFFPILVFVDLTLVAAALKLSDLIRKNLQFGMVLSQETNWLNVSVYIAALGAWFLAFFVVGAHQPRRVAEGRAWSRIPIAGFLGMLFFLAALFFLKIYDFSRLLVAYFAIVAQLLLLVRNIGTSIILQKLSGPFSRRVLLIAGGDVGCEVASRLETMPFGMSLIGIIATDEKLSNRPTLGALDEVSELVKLHRIDNVFIALPAEQHAMMEDVILMLQADPVRIHFVPDVLELTMVRATVEDFFGIPMVGLREPPLDEAGQIAKRAFDLVFGGLAALLATPIMVGCAIAVKLYDKGPVFFRQSRIGENGQPFGMLKFRSMVVNAEAKLKDLGIDVKNLPKDNPVFKLQNDPRITPIGRLLRRWSLDELPQLLNVLKGDMSLVGPRPEEASVVAQYSFSHRNRLAVKPGITGPMQVNGRGDLPLKQRLHLELAYIESWTLWSDLKILAKTIPVVLWGKGAY